MTLFPRNARSELVLPTNLPCSGDVDSNRRFQAASPASYSPARKPTRGSGLGGAAFMALPIGVGPMAPPDELTVLRAQAPAAPIATMTNSDFKRWAPETNCI